MKFISVRDLRTSPAKVWKDLGVEQQIIITNNGKPIALLTPLTDSNLEQTLSAVRKALAINAVNKMQQISIERGNNELKDDELDKIITESRKQK